ncbi:uncharacterized protein LAJ45_11717 [Morchella importuna]|uniref:uncharacterized protein n=1 Tax=Morchella importuna TaxID=1174673 RepID=UPI001E8C9F8E|nr:uncharacterized protein LAJ45_11717 [Morchella importuna]KAH8144321.1 hypothetical protein LAJ45_11717 [Morchella importuna]
MEGLKNSWAAFIVQHGRQAIPANNPPGRRVSLVSRRKQFLSTILEFGKQQGVSRETLHVAMGIRFFHTDMQWCLLSRTLPPPGG